MTCFIAAGGCTPPDDDAPEGNREAVVDGHPREGHKEAIQPTGADSAVHPPWGQAPALPRAAAGLSPERPPDDEGSGDLTH
eukprot:7489228-Pyramimonas_sp.AAC.1